LKGEVVPERKQGFNQERVHVALLGVRAKSEQFGGNLWGGGREGEEKTEVTEYSKN